MFIPVEYPCECKVVHEPDSPEGERYSVYTPIAVSEDERRSVAVLTSLYPFEENGFLIHDFHFAIAVTDFDNEEVFETYDRDMAKGYIPEGARPRVMECVCRAIPTLVEYVNPQAIYRVTKATRPPEKALKKHDLVTEGFQDCGFEITQRGTDATSREYWVMER